MSSLRSYSMPLRSYIPTPAVQSWLIETSPSHLMFQHECFKDILVDYLLGKAAGPDSGVATHPRQSRRYSTKLTWTLLMISSFLNHQSRGLNYNPLTRTADAAANLGLIISAPKTEMPPFLRYQKGRTFIPCKEERKVSIREGRIRIKAEQGGAGDGY